MPSLYAREDKIGYGYHVVVEWQDGVSEQVSDFTSQAEAEQWIEVDSAAWIQRHPKSKSVLAG